MTKNLGFEDENFQSFKYERVPASSSFFATTLVDLLFIELKLHLSHVKQMYSQTIHLEIMYTNHKKKG